MASYAEVEDGEEDDSDDDGPGDEGSNANVEAVKQVSSNNRTCAEAKAAGNRPRSTQIREVPQL